MQKQWIYNPIDKFLSSKDMYQFHILVCLLGSKHVSQKHSKKIYWQSKKKNTMKKEYLVACHLCCNGMTWLPNCGLPCTCQHHFHLGTELQNIIDIGRRDTILKTDTLFELSVVLEIFSKGDYLYHGLIPNQDDLSFQFTTEHCCVMHNIVEEVYDMTGLWRYFGLFNRKTQPALTEHPSLGHWTSLAKIQPIQLFATFHQSTIFMARIN